MLKIEKIGSLYGVIATPPHVRLDWSTEEPLPMRELINELRNRGSHQTDIGDAFYDADPDWISN